MRATITRKLRVDDMGGMSFRIVGEPEAESWRKSLRPDREPWCEVNMTKDGHVTTYGGEVWPTAWPSLFEVVHPNTRDQAIRVRPEAMPLFQGAV